jgi:hypothetical protein
LELAEHFLRHACPSVYYTDVSVLCTMGGVVEPRPPCSNQISSNWWICSKTRDVFKQDKITVRGRSA